MTTYLGRLSLAGVVFACVLAAGVPAVFAHHPDLKSPFKVDNATQAPGITLQPNTDYVLSVAKSDSDRHMVRIYNKDESQLLTTFLGVSQWMASANQSGFEFIDTQSGFPKALQAWSHPQWGGLTFVYSTEEARNLALHSNEAVMSTSTRVSSTRNLNAIQVASIQPNGTSRIEPLQTAQAGREALPATAGELSLLALIGVACIGIGLAWRFAQSRRLDKVA